MNHDLDLHAPLLLAQSLLAAQQQVVSKSLLLQQKTSQQLCAFWMAEAEHACHLSTPQQLLKFQLQVNRQWLGLMKSQGEAYSHLATETIAGMAAQLRRLVH